MHYVQTIKQLNYTRTLIPSDTRSNAKVDVCVFGGCQLPKKRPVFLSKTSVIFFQHVVLLLNET